MRFIFQATTRDIMNRVLSFACIDHRSSAKWTAQSPNQALEPTIPGVTPRAEEKATSRATWDRGSSLTLGIQDEGLDIRIVDTGGRRDHSDAKDSLKKIWRAKDIRIVR